MDDRNINKIAKIRNKISAKRNQIKDLQYKIEMLYEDMAALRAHEIKLAEKKSQNK